MSFSNDAQEAGFDLSLVTVALQRSYDERALEHQDALNLALELEMIGRRQRESTQPIAPDSLRR
jgi:hypothetical protein